MSGQLDGDIAKHLYFTLSFCYVIVKHPFTLLCVRPQSSGYFYLLPNFLQFCVAQRAMYIFPSKIASKAIEYLVCILFLNKSFCLTCYPEIPTYLA